MSQTEIQEIYKRVLINREQISKRALEQKDSLMENQLNRIFQKYFKLMQNPKITAAVQDEAKRDISKMLDVLMMNADHDVIMALSNMEIEKKYKEKIKHE